jgi:hypothetical protein
MFELPSRSQEHREDTPRKPAPNYFSRREQMRLLVLVGSLMLVFILMIEAGKPKNWAWLWGLNNNDGLANAERIEKDIDTRIPPSPNPETNLDPDVFISPADEPPTEDPDQAEEDGFFPGVKPNLLATVRDDMLLLSAESDAWYHLLAVLKDADEADLEGASQGRVGFVQLFEQAKEYRGHLVTIRGVVRSAKYESDIPKNSYDIDGYWIMCLSPAGSPTYPILVYSLDMPDGFPESVDMKEKVEFTGFSYKRKAYQAKGHGGAGETRTAPLVLAKIGQWTPPAPEETPKAKLWMVVVSVCGTALLAIGIAMFVYIRSGEVSETAEQYSTLGKAKPGELEALEKTELGPDVGEQLGKISSKDNDVV